MPGYLQGARHRRLAGMRGVPVPAVERQGLAPREELDVDDALVDRDEAAGDLDRPRVALVLLVPGVNLQRSRVELSARLRDRDLVAVGEVMEVAAVRRAAHPAGGFVNDEQRSAIVQARD